MGVNKRLTIGFQLQTLYDDYSKKLWPAAVETARNHDVNLIVFPGESLKVPYDYGYQCNPLYDLISKHDLDAMIWLANTLGTWIPPEEVDAYFKSDRDRQHARSPLQAAGMVTSYDIWANVSGGGTTGQADAVKLGLARALAKAVPEVSGALREKGLMTRDSRMKERKKYGRRGARRSFQFSKR